jgi:hypothetical protein
LEANMPILPGRTRTGETCNESAAPPRRS